MSRTVKTLLKTLAKPCDISNQLSILANKYLLFTNVMSISNSTDCTLDLIMVLQLESYQPMVKIILKKLTYRNRL